MSSWEDLQHAAHEAERRLVTDNTQISGIPLDKVTGLWVTWGESGRSRTVNGCHKILAVVHCEAMPDQPVLIIDQSRRDRRLPTLPVVVSKDMRIVPPPGPDSERIVAVDPDSFSYSFNPTPSPPNYRRAQRKNPKPIPGGSTYTAGP